MDLTKLEASLVETNKNITTAIERMDKGAEDLGTLQVKFEELKSTQKRQEEWLRDVDATAKKRAEIGADGRNSLLEAIPAHLRGNITIADMHLNSSQNIAKFGRRDPIVYAAHSIWVQREIMRQGAMSKPEKYAEYSKEIDNLQKGFGAQLVAQAAMGENTSGYGGELILTPVEAEVLRQVQDNSYIRQVARVMPMVSKEHKIPSLDTDFTAAFIAGGAGITDSAATTNWSQKSLTAKKLAGIATLDSELIQDSAIALADFLYGAIAEAIGRLEDTEAIEGTGTNWTGVNAATGVKTIAATTNGDVLTYKSKLVAALFACLDVDSRQNAAWFMSPAGAVQAFGLTDTNNMPAFQLPNAEMRTQLPAGARGMLLGYPAFVHSGIKSDRTKGSGTTLTNLYFGNWKKLIIGDLLGLTFATDPYSLFSNDQVKVRVIKRTGAVVGVPKSFVVVKDITTT